MPPVRVQGRERDKNRERGGVRVRVSETGSELGWAS